MSALLAARDAAVAALTREAGAAVAAAIGSRSEPHDLIATSRCLGEVDSLMSAPVVDALAALDAAAYDEIRRRRESPAVSAADRLRSVCATYTTNDFGEAEVALADVREVLAALDAAAVDVERARRTEATALRIAGRLRDELAQAVYERGAAVAAVAAKRTAALREAAVLCREQRTMHRRMGHAQAIDRADGAAGCAEEIDALAAPAQGGG